MGALGGLAILAFGATVLDPAGDRQTVLLVSDLGMLAASLTAAVTALVAARLRSAGASCYSWLLIGLGLISYALGDAYWAWIELVLGEEASVPSWADLGYLGSLPLLLVGILLRPIQCPRRLDRWLLLLDTGVALSALAAVSWTVVLGPLFAAQETGPLTQAIVLAYPLGDLAILLCLLMLVLREAETHPATALLVIGLSAIAIADSAYLALTVYDAYQTGNPVEVLWFAGMIALALAAMLDPAPAAATALPESTGVGRVWRFLVPATLVGMAGVVVWADSLLRQGRWADPGQVALGLGWVLLVVRSIRGYRDAVLAHQYERVAGEEARQLALRDPLTRVANRRAFEAALDDCVARARAGGGSFGLAFVDADRLKAYNDTYGHVAGDAALRELAADLTAEAAPWDVVARIGGDEFALLMVDADVPALWVREERLRHRLGGQRALRASVGFSIWLPSMQSPSELLEAADRQLYAAKRRHSPALVS